MTQIPFLLPKLGYTILFTFNGLRFNQKVIENDHHREKWAVCLSGNLYRDRTKAAHK